MATDERFEGPHVADLGSLDQRRIVGFAHERHRQLRRLSRSMVSQ